MALLDETIHLCILYIVDSAVIVVNVVLICIIAMRTPVAKRSYAVFLLNSAIIDVTYTFASAICAARIFLLPDNKVAIIYLGQCFAIGGIKFCNFCESMQMYMMLESTIILMLSFGYRRYIIRTGTAYVRLPPRKVVWCWCVVAYLSIAPLWYLSFASLRERSSAVARDLRNFDNTAISWLYDFDMRVVIVVTFALLFTPIATLVMLVLRKSLITHLSKMSKQAQIHHGYIIQALTYQMILPIGFLITVLVWFIVFSTIESGHLVQMLIFVIGSNSFKIASPLITLIYLPSYRKVFTNIEISMRTHIGVI